MIDFSSGTTVLTLVGVVAVLTALALERARVLPVPGSVLVPLGIAFMALG